MLESHASMRDDFQISIAELDLAVETAMSQGAIGARLTGGGFGGAAIALIAADKVANLKTAVSDKFREQGFEKPEIFTVTADEGAKREI